MSEAGGRKNSWNVFSFFLFVFSLAATLHPIFSTIFPTRFPTIPIGIRIFIIGLFGSFELNFVFFFFIRIIYRSFLKRMFTFLLYIEILHYLS